MSYIGAYSALSSITASIIPMSLGFTIFTDKKFGAVAGIIGALIIFVPCIYLVIDAKINKPKPGDTTDALMMYYPTYFIVALVIICISMMVMRR